jgi:hypothetical protein
MQQTKIVFVTGLSLFFLATACSSKTKKDAAGAPPAKATTAGTAATKAAPVAPKKELPPIQQKPNEIKCVSGKDERIISVQSLGQGCQVVYTKHTEISPIANSAKSMDHCDSVAGQVREKLEAAGFKCQ